MISPNIHAAIATELTTVLDNVRACGLTVRDELYNPSFAIPILGYPFLDTE